MNEPGLMQVMELHQWMMAGGVTLLVVGAVMVMYHFIRVLWDDRDTENMNTEKEE